MVRGNAFHEADETLGLGELVAHLEVLLGLNPKQHEGENEETDPGISPSGPRLVTQVQDTEDQRNQEQDDDCGHALGRFGALVGDDVVKGVEVHGCAFSVPIGKSAPSVSALDSSHSQGCAYQADATLTRCRPRPRGRDAETLTCSRGTPKLVPARRA